MKQAPSGLGIFVWEPSMCEGGDVQKVIAKAKASGISWIIMHGFLLASWVSALKNAGFYVAYSQYVTPTSVESFVTNAQSACHLGVDAILLDAEEEWEVFAGKPHWFGKEATTFVNTLRALLGPDVFLADAGAWAFPNLHPQYPDKEFGTGLDAAMPERYWTESTETFDDYIVASERAWTNYPDVQGYSQIIPIGSAYGANTSPKAGVSPLNVEDVSSFIQRYPTCALWSWLHVPQVVWDLLAMRGGAT